MKTIFDLLSGTRVLEKTLSQYNKDIEVIKDLTWGTYIKVGGLTQSGGILFDVWQNTLQKLQKTKPEVKNCLILGLGGGSVAKIIAKKYPKAKIRGVDIDKVMVDLGKKYLGLTKIKIEIKIQDAYEFVIKNLKSKYDLIVVDLYCGDKFPKKFEQSKFLKLSHELMSTDSVIVFNRLYGPNNQTRSLAFGKVLEKHFKKVDHIFPQANLMFVCYN